MAFTAFEIGLSKKSYQVTLSTVINEISDSYKPYRICEAVDFLLTEGFLYSKYYYFEFKKDKKNIALLLGTASGGREGEENGK